MILEFKKTIKDFHIGFVVGHIFNFFVWYLLQGYTNNRVAVYPWYYISLGVSYVGLWVQLLVVYIIKILRK
jgi:hypothetical protein